MALQTWLADVVRSGGVTVIEVDGWRTRQTRDGFTPRGIVGHDTVTSPMSRAAEQAVLVKGRTDLTGPLAQMGVHRDGVLSVIAAGRCNHNGYGTWGNDSFGIEVFCRGGMRGQEEPWNAAQRDTVVRASAAICTFLGWTPASTWKGHKETDPTRKIDPYGVDCNAIRAAVSAQMHPAPAPPPPRQEDFEHMAATDINTIYQANLGRAVDPGGLGFRIGQVQTVIDGGGTYVDGIAVVNADVYASDEAVKYRAAHPG